MSAAKSLKTGFSQAEIFAGRQVRSFDASCVRNKSRGNHMERGQDTALTHKSELADRRAFLLASLAAGATSLVPRVASAAQAGSADQAAVRLVTDFCAAVSKLDPAAMR